MILGVCLVVNELDKGQRLVFRYPESIPSLNASNKEIVKLYEQYFSFSQENLAKLFRPKNALSHKILEFSIDNLSFISYPCLCPSHSDPSKPLPLESVSSNSHKRSSGDVITMFNIVFATVNSNAMMSINPQFIYKCQTKQASTPGSDPIAAAMGLRIESYGICKQTLKRVAETVCNALFQQEKKSRYVTSQVSLMLKILDHWNEPLSTTATSSSTLGGLMLYNNQNRTVTHDADASCFASINADGYANVTIDQTTTTENLSFHSLQRTGNINNISSKTNSFVSRRSTSSSPPPIILSSDHSDIATTTTTAIRTTTPSITVDNNLIAVSVVPNACLASPKQMKSGSSNMLSNNYTTSTTTVVETITSSSLIAATTSGGSNTTVSQVSRTINSISGDNNASNFITVGINNSISSSSGSHKSTVAASVVAAPPKQLVGSNSNNIQLVNSNNGNSNTTNNNISSGGGRAAAAEWGLHLMEDFLSQSSLANELRILYHNLVGGHSLNISFHDMKTNNISLCCKDRKCCEDSYHLLCKYGISGCGDANSEDSTNILNQLMTLYNNSSSSGGNNINKNAALRTECLSSGAVVVADINNTTTTTSNTTTTTNTVPRRPSGKNLLEYVKIKGINLNTQTMLTIADTDSIINVLQSLDRSSNISTAATTIGSSSNGNSNNDLQGGGGGGLKQLQQQVDCHNHQHQLKKLSNSRLYTFIDAADPTLSFLDLSLVLDEPVEELISMANYLQSWGLAEIIPIIYSRSCYKVHTHAQSSRDSRVARAYESLLLSFNLVIPLLPASNSNSSNIANPASVRNATTVNNNNDQSYSSWQLNTVHSNNCSNSAAAASGCDEIRNSSRFRSVSGSCEQQLQQQQQQFNISTVRSNNNNKSTLSSAITAVNDMGNGNSNSSSSHHYHNQNPHLISPPAAAFHWRGAARSKQRGGEGGGAGSSIDISMSNNNSSAPIPVPVAATTAIIPSSNYTKGISSSADKTSRSIAGNCQSTVDMLFPTSAATGFSANSGRSRSNPTGSNNNSSNNNTTIPTLSRGTTDNNNTVSGSSSNSSSTGSSWQQSSSNSLSAAFASFFGSSSANNNTVNAGSNANGTTTVASNARSLGSNSSNQSSSNTVNTSVSSGSMDDDYQIGSSIKNNGTLAMAAKYIINLSESDSMDDVNNSSSNGGDTRNNKHAIAITGNNSFQLLDQKPRQQQKQQPKGNNHNCFDNTTASSSYPNSSSSSSSISYMNSNNNMSSASLLARAASSSGQTSSSVNRKSLLTGLTNTAAAASQQHHTYYSSTSPPKLRVLVPVQRLDCAENLPPSFGLPALLAIFNGTRSMQEAVELLPLQLREYAVDLVVFLLRWHMIAQVDSYIVNLERLLEYDEDNKLLLPHQQQSAEEQHGGNEQQYTNYRQYRPPLQLGDNHLTNSSNSINSSASHKKYSASNLSSSELAIIDKIAPFLQESTATISYKTVSEIAWMTRINEAELTQVIEKIPLHLQIVKKLSS